jgi:hypothetical protein
MLIRETQRPDFLSGALSKCYLTRAELIAGEDDDAIDGVRKRPQEKTKNLSIPEDE